MIEAGLDFLNYRNVVIYHIGNPKKELSDLLNICKKAIDLYSVFRDEHRRFFELVAPFRFGSKELEYFYGNKVEEEIDVAKDFEKK